MKALVYLGKESLDYRDFPEPVAGPGEAVVRVDSCGICGSDMHGYHGHDPRRVPPMVMGHEAAGVVETGALAGRRVAVNPFLFCGRCANCQTGAQHLCLNQRNIGLPPHAGAFADRVVVPEENLVEIPDSMAMETAALAEPLAVSYHAVQLAARLMRRPLPAARAVVLGGGAIGLGTALALAISGTGRIAIAEPHPGRRATAARADPAFHVYDPAAEEPQAQSVDVVFDAVGARSTREAAFRMAARGAVVIHLGLLPGSEGVDVRRMTLGEIIFAGSYCYSMPDFRETVALLAHGRFGDLSWTEQRPMREGAQAFGDLDTGRTASAKIILRN
ncbi:zinc-dependent alcohol dehydrogenase [Aquibium microcysteis]|uniref:zinc-dependent alcohol dehydrogenase n=1 Tax=Aquibium microcysteis TaxID=675281 RepID=UPI00165D1475|nr:alcohol dehydrogenase catalytic domain-containing protein [Aquibium microcysteis]